MAARLTTIHYRHQEVPAINTTATIHSCRADLFFGPPISGHKWLAVPILSFLIRHPTLNQALLFDLGIRKDWGNLAPGSIDGIILFHRHFDHIGDPANLPPSVPLTVGPGFTRAMIPGYPTNPASVVRESDYAGRQITEIDFGQGGCKIGNFDALDFFGDGSLYLLDAPGHTVGHICAFARVTPTPFVLLAGDAIHHAGELRPTPYLQLPEQISPSPFSITPRVQNQLGSVTFSQMDQLLASTSHGPAMVQAGITMLVSCGQRLRSCRSSTATIRVYLTLLSSLRQGHLIGLSNKTEKERELGGFSETLVKRST
ncbi:hypothetical protein QBC36DRAFT_360801 [Triangularia setosa]|uniref:Metallo-beta-lactamase domain-containing protein n=1 Tax=Triangularia setosa TaxID=2587417 RepID=A0AAN6W0B5_9PEZI|nr:hypothetical protein QBC36DRAFT_360801 [Podospora setosa]